MIFSRDLFGRPIKRNVPMIILLIVGKDTNQENLRHKERRITRYICRRVTEVIANRGSSRHFCRPVPIGVIISALT